MAGCLPVIVLLLLATAPAAIADTQSTSAAQGTQGAENAQIFGLPPLPVALVGLGTLLSKVHSPINLNTRIITDKPAQQAAADTNSTVTATETVSSSQDEAQQQQPQAASSQPAAGTYSAVPPGVTSWIQNPDGTITPLKWDKPDSQATAVVGGSQTTQTDGDSDNTSMQGQVVSGTIVTGTVIPITPLPAQQGGSFNYTGAMSQQNVTYSTPNNTQDAIQQGSTIATVVTQAPMVVAMPVTQPQPQQHQVWMPVNQGVQMVQQGYYYSPGQSKGAQVVQGGYYYSPGQQVGPTVAVGNTRFGPKGGWGVRKVQGSGWVSGGMRPASVMMPAGSYGQVQGPMWVQQGQGSMVTRGPSATMGTAPGMGGPAAGFTSGSSSTDDSSSGSSMDDSSAQQQQQWGQGTSGGFGGNPGQQARAVVEPTVIIVDKTNPNSNAGPAQPTKVTVTPPQGSSQPGGRNSGPAGPAAGMGPRQGPAAAAAAGLRGPMGRRPPAMIPLNGPPQGAGGVMAGPGAGSGGMDGDDNMNN